MPTTLGPQMRKPSGFYHRSSNLYTYYTHTHACVWFITLNTPAPGLVSMEKGYSKWKIERGLHQLYNQNNPHLKLGRVRPVLHSVGSFQRYQKTHYGSFNLDIFFECRECAGGCQGPAPMHLVWVPGGLQFWPRRLIFIFSFVFLLRDCLINGGNSLLSGIR